MSLISKYSACRCVWLVVGLLTGLVMAIPQAVGGQGITLTGVGEGSVIYLPAGSTTTNLTVAAMLPAPTGTTNVAYVLECQGNVIFNYSAPPPYAVTFTNLTAGKYFLSAALLSPGTPPTGSVSFDIHPAARAPANDNWNQAGALPGLNLTVTSFNADATSEAGEPVHGGLGAGKSVWWSWTAAASGVFTVTTAGSSFDTVLAVYSGSTLGTLTEEMVNDDASPNAFSQATFFATNGTTYYFAVDSASSAAYGEVRLRLVAGGPPALAVTSPADGLLLLVPTPTTATNTSAVAVVHDPAGIARVDYWLDVGDGVTRSGTLAAPYQLRLANLTEGNYTLTLAASNNWGLVSAINVGFSVVSLAPLLVTERLALSAGGFQLAMVGFKGPNYSLQASTNLDAWCSLKTFTNFTGAEKVVDLNATQFNQRFYRAATTP